MPKLISEIHAGGVNEKSSDGGALAQSHVRNWRIVLDNPNESYDVQQAVGVKIGDAHPTNPQVPCISISERPDGESRMVRLVTATYRTTPGTDNQEDPNSQPPDVRPARYSITSSLIEVPATQWRVVNPGMANVLVIPENGFNFFDPAVPFGNPNALVGGELGDPEFVLNPVGDRIDGVTKLVPIINITIEQFDSTPTRNLDDSGKVNSDDFLFLGLEVVRFTCMLRNISVRPVVETFGDRLYRGFIRTYDFAIKTCGGWLVDQLLEGFNIINDGLNNPNVDQDVIALEHDPNTEQVKTNPLQLAAGTQGKKVRASVLIAGRRGGKVQRPSAQPVALNSNGTPRPRSANPPVLRRLYLTQPGVPFGTNFSEIGVRIRESL